VISVMERVQVRVSFGLVRVRVNLGLVRVWARVIVRSGDDCRSLISPG